MSETEEEDENFHDPTFNCALFLTGLPAGVMVIPAANLENATGAFLCQLSNDRLGF